MVDSFDYGLRVVKVWALAGDIVLCSYTGRFTPTVPLSTQVYGQNLRDIARVNQSD